VPELRTQQGLTLYYDREGEGTPILFLHGWGVDRRIWRQQVKHFCHDHETYSLDLPGHGRSLWPLPGLEGFPGIEDLAAGILQILDGKKKIKVVASSFGGLVALEMIKQNPESVSACAFVGSPPCFMRGSDFPFGLEIQQIQKLTDQLESDYPAIVHVFFRSLFTRQERASRRFKWIQTFRRTDSVPQRQALIHLLRVLTQSDQREVLFALKIPVQFLSGTEDMFFSQELGEAIKQRLPHARLTWFEHCGHFPFLSKPHEFNEELGRFLNGAKT